MYIFVVVEKNLVLSYVGWISTLSSSYVRSINVPNVILILGRVCSDKMSKMVIESIKAHAEPENNYFRTSI